MHPTGSAHGRRKSVVPLLALAILCIGLASCGQGKGTAGQQQSSDTALQPVGQQARPATAAPAVAPRPPTGPDVGPQVVQRLSENSYRGRDEDASAIESGQAPRYVSAALATQALDNPDERVRGSAVATVALQRSDDATDLLLTSATDPAPAVRYRAVQALWISAKDLPDRFTDIQAAIRAAAADSSPTVASLAERALEDLRKQRQP